MRFRALIVLALGLLAAPCVPPAVAAPHLVRTLPSKMGLIVRENRTRPLAAVQVWIHSGSRDESRTERAAAAALSYLPFEETQRRKRGELAKEVESIGGTYGSESGYGQIVFNMTVPARHLDRALAILSDAVAKPLFSQYTLDQSLAKARRATRGVVQAAGSASLDPIRAALFADSPLGAPTAVPEIEIAALTIPILERYHRTHFVAENMTVVVVGDVEAEAVASQVQTAFADVPRGKLPARPRVQVKPMSGPSLSWTPAPTAETQGAAVSVGFRTPEWGTADALALDVLMALLVDSPTSRFEKRLQEGTGEFFAAAAHRSIGPDGGMVALSLTADPSRLGDAEGVLVQEIEKARSQPITQEETDAAIRAVIQRDLASLSELWGLARMTAIAAAQGRMGADEVYVQRLRAIRPEDLAGVARKYFDWRNAAVVEMTSRALGDSLGLKGSFAKRFQEKLSLYQGTYRTGPQATASVDEARRARIDAPLARIAAAPFDPGRGRVERSILPGGLTLLASEDRSAPGVTIAVYMRGGVRYENDKNNGITSLVRESMLNSVDPRGGGRTYRQSLTLMGALVPYQDRDMWGVSLSVPSDRWKEGLERLATMIVTPDLDTTNVDATRIYLLTALDQWLEDDNAQRQRLIFHTKYAVSGYRLPGIGTKVNLIGMPQQAVVDFHRKFVVKPNMVVAVFGDVAPSETSGAVTSAFRGASDAKFAPGMVARELPFTGVREKWELGAGPDVTVQLAFDGPPADSPDIPVMYVVNSLLSGPYGWFAKYMETEQLVIDASSIVAQAVDESPIVASVQIRGMVQEEPVVKLLFRQFKKVAGLELVGPELTADFRNAKTHAVASYLATFSSNTSRAFQWARAEVLDLPRDYVLTLPSKMETVTSDDVLRIGKKYFQKADWESHAHAIAETRPGGW